MGRWSASITALRQYTQLHVSTDDAPEIDAELFSSSDRACALLNGALVERSIESALELKMRKDMSNTARAELFGMDGPVGTFSGKIALGYALELFGHKTRHDLDVIRHIRNAFAHCRKPIDFQLPVVSAVCDTLIFPDMEDIHVVPRIMRRPGRIAFWPEEHSHFSPRAKFEISCATVAKNIDWVWVKAKGLAEKFLP